MSDEEEWQKALALNAELKQRELLLLREYEQQRLKELERTRVERDSAMTHGTREKFSSMNGRHAAHLPASAILRRRQDTKIVRENKKIALRLDRVGEGGVRSSGYGRRAALPIGPLAKKNLQMIAQQRRQRRLQQPEMSF